MKLFIKAEREGYAPDQIRETMTVEELIPDSDGQLFTIESGRKVLMERYGDSKFPFSGVNEDGERVLISIAADSIVINTFQTNGWVRVNYYDAEGLADGETFSGRWK